MITPATRQTLRKLRIRTSRMITSLFAGEYQSAFKGKGIEFRELREYQPGDDIRFIDWNVTARTGHPHVKKFIEERELTVIFLIDLSASFQFGTVNGLKTRLAAELCSLFSLTAVRNNDKVGLILFTDRIEKFVPPRKGDRHAMRILRDALSCVPEGMGTNIPLALAYLNRVLKRNTIAFLISDFYGENLRKPLAVANKRHDLIAMTISDPAELSLPKMGLCQFYDPETEETFMVDTSDQAVRAEFERRSHERLELRRKLFWLVNVDHIHIMNGLPYHRTLIAFFRSRGRRIHR